VSAIVMRALERDPGRRFPDAGSFAEALRVWQRDPAAGASAAAAAGAARVAGAAAATGTTPPAAPVPPAGEPTVYVPPRVARPSDRAPMAPGGQPRRPAATYERESGSWWVWLLALLAVILLGAIGFLGAQIIGGLGPNASPSPSAGEFTLPNWEGQPIVGVREDAERRNLVLDERPEPSETVLDDHVISTTPSGGSLVHEGDTIVVLVSTGPDEVLVPTLVGQTEDQAVQTLNAAGLRLGSVTEEPSAQPAGRVIRSDPGAGTPVLRDSQVNLILSSGPTPSPTPEPTPPPTPEPTPTPTLEPTPTPAP